MYFPLKTASKVNTFTGMIYGILKINKGGGESRKTGGQADGLWKSFYKSDATFLIFPD
jgi:hypothetical protein